MPEWRYEERRYSTYEDLRVDSAIDPALRVRVTPREDERRRVEREVAEARVPGEAWPEPFLPDPGFPPGRPGDETGPIPGRPGQRVGPEPTDWRVVGKWAFRVLVLLGLAMNIFSACRATTPGMTVFWVVMAFCCWLGFLASVL